jgi:hypothetical protein
MNKKRGLSKVVATLIIILLAMIAIGIVWVAVKNLIGTQVDIAEAEWEFFNERIEITRVRIDTGPDLNLGVTLKRFTGKLTVEIFNETEPEPVEVDIVSVVDLSGSMSFCDDVNTNCDTDSECNSVLGAFNYVVINGVPGCYGAPSDRLNNCAPICGGVVFDRLTPTREANRELVNTVLVDPEESDSRIGLVAYKSNIHVPGTIDLTESENTGALNNIIDSWEAGGGTCICCGINAASTILQSSPAEINKTIIVMSDGVATTECDSVQGTGDARADAIQAACDAKDAIANLTIHSVGAGTGVDETALESIATCGEGTYFPVADVSNLISVYEQIAGNIIKESTSRTHLNYIKIVFYNEESQSVSKEVPVPETLESKTTNFDLTGEIIGPIVKIEIYPVIISRGDEIVGPMLDFWEAK